MTRVEVWRGPVVESRHRVHVAVVDAAGRPVAGSGELSALTIARSAVKPIQALPVVAGGAADRYTFGDEEIALCCASHSGEPCHVDVVRRMLARIDVEETALACGSHSPYHGPSADALVQAGVRPGRIHNNCSGKHAGMLALACHHGWPLEGYNREDHPVQQRMLDEIARWAQVPRKDIALAVDGCGVVTFGVSLERLAGAFARLAAAARAEEPAPARVLGAMSRHPGLTAGTGRLCTDLMRAVDGRIVVKTGAEGVYCAAVPGAELGVALKVEDGGRRASGPALIGVLRALALLTEEHVDSLSEHAEPEIRNTRGEVVGRVRAIVQIEAPGR